jgi:hypothetical protein
VPRTSNDYRLESRRQSHGEGPPRLTGDGKRNSHGELPVRQTDASGAMYDEDETAASKMTADEMQITRGLGVQPSVYLRAKMRRKK